MIINELYLKNFGKFQNRKFSFQKGINVIYGENEGGKTTLHTFIHSIFFGLKRKRGRASRTDAYTRYTPWEMPSWYEGSVRFSSGGKTFLLEQNFKKGEEGSRLICETDGELLSVEDGDLEMLLGEISETVYENTVSIGQMKSRTDDALLQELRNYLSSYQGTGDGALDIEQAQQLLKKRKKEYLIQEQQLREQQEKEEEKLRYEMQYLYEEMEFLKVRLEEQKTEVINAEAKKTETKKTETKKTEEKKEYVQTSMGKKEERSAGRYPEVLEFFFLPLFILSALCFWKGSGLAGFAFGLAGICFLIGLFFFRKRKKEVLYEADGIEKMQDRETDGAEEENLKQMKMKWRVWKEEYQEKRIRYTNLQEELEELELDSSGDQGRKTELEGVSIAMDTIQELTVKMQQRIGDSLKENMSQILCSITDGRYRKISIDDEFKVSLFTKSGYVPLYQVSHGTVEQVYLALRIAVGEILAPEEPLPLVLDEVFSMYDDGRLLRSLQWLSAKKEQILLFTCNKREVEALERAGIPYHLVSLGQTDR